MFLNVEIDVNSPAPNFCSNIQRFSSVPRFPKL